MDRKFKERLTCSEVDHDVDEKYCVAETIERDPSSAQIIIKEWYGHRQND